MASHFFAPPQHASQYTLPEKVDILPSKNQALGDLIYNVLYNYVYQLIGMSRE